VWSVGVILYVLLAGYLPFDENTMVALFQKIKNADFEYPDWFSSEARDLLAKILVPDPHSRINLNDIKGHPWMNHADSGPEPSKGDNSAATAGAPAVSNPTGSHSTPTAAAASTSKAAPAAAASTASATASKLPTPPPAAAAAAPAASSPKAPAAATTPPAPPAAAQATSAATPVAARSKSTDSQGETAGGGGGFFGCCASKHYDSV
jgi:serine/threonine protein kinase